MSFRWCLTVLVMSLTGCIIHDNNSPSPAALVQVDQEPPGANCKYGGVAIESGIDTNGNGVLDASEVTSTQYVCNGDSDVECGTGATTATGEITVQSDSDLAQLVGVTCVQGDLIIAGTDLTALPQLSTLTTVTGSVYVVGNTALTSLSDLQSVEQIGSICFVQANPLLTDIGAIAKLMRVGSIEIINNDALTDLSGLSPITSLDASLNVSGNAGLTSLTGLDNLASSTQSITIDSNESLTSTSALDHLTSVPELDVSSNAELQEVSLAALTRLNVVLTIDQNASLKTISLPSLECSLRWCADLERHFACVDRHARAVAERRRSRDQRHRADVDLGRSTRGGVRRRRPRGLADDPEHQLSVARSDRWLAVSRERPTEYTSTDSRRSRRLAARCGCKAQWQPTSPASPRCKASAATSRSRRTRT